MVRKWLVKDNARVINFIFNRRTDFQPSPVNFYFEAHIPDYSSHMCFLLFDMPCCNIMFFLENSSAQFVLSSDPAAGASDDWYKSLGMRSAIILEALASKLLQKMFINIITKFIINDQMPGLPSQRSFVTLATMDLSFQPIRSYQVGRYVSVTANLI